MLITSLVSVTVKLLVELIPAEVKLMASRTRFKVMLLKKGNEKTQQTNREGVAKEYLEGQIDFLSLSFLQEKARKGVGDKG